MDMDVPVYLLLAMACWPGSWKGISALCDCFPRSIYTSYLSSCTDRPTDIVVWYVCFGLTFTVCNLVRASHSPGSYVYLLEIPVLQ